MNNDELKETVEQCKPSYEELEHENNVLMEKNIQLQRTIDALLRALVQSDYERNCNLECSNHYMKLYLQESQRANKLFDEQKATVVCPYCCSKNTQTLWKATEFNKELQRHYICDDCHKEFNITAKKLEELENEIIY